MPPATKINHEQFCIDYSFTAASMEPTNEEFIYWVGNYYQLLSELWFLPSVETSKIFGGINLAKVITDGEIDERKLIYTITVGFRLAIRYCIANNLEEIIILLTNIPGATKLINNLDTIGIDEKILAGMRETLKILGREKAAVIPKITFFGLGGQKVEFVTK